MEDGLVQNENGNEDKAKQVCLNPCCNGRWSRTSLNRTLEDVIFLES